MISNTFTTPPAGSVHIRLNIIETDLKLHFQFKTTDLTNDLGYAEYGDTKACLDLPSSTKGSLVIYGTIDSPLPDTVYHIVAEIYEIKVNGTETCPSKYVIICKFMVRVMVFNATFNNIIYRGGRHRCDHMVVGSMTTYAISGFLWALLLPPPIKLTATI
jgi:hypothetical protein